MTDDPIAVLEDRMKALEIKLFGQSDSSIDLSLPIVDSLLESHKVVSSSLSGREKLASVVKRLDQLEAVLDPMYEDSVIDNAAKLAFILSMEEDLGEITRELVRVNELSSYLESEQLRLIPQLMKQLAKLMSITAEHKERHDLLEDRFNDLINKYTGVISGVTAVFATLDSLVSEMEIKARPKEIID